MTDTFKTNNPTIFVILGVTGDLARRKLIPALYDLHRRRLLPKLFQVVGFSRRDLTDADLRGEVQSVIGIPPAHEREVLEAFEKLFVYRRGDFTEREGYDNLAEFLGRKDGEWRVCSNKLFYLAVPPTHYADIFRHLDKSGLTEPCSPEEGWTRVIVEKPFGKDAETAEELDRMLGKLFKEEQIYRIDHYLGKETVQNILAFRFSNVMLAPAWNRKHITSIAIRLHEEHGVGGRGEFYDGVGALRDVGQNHLLQLLALFTMEEPADMRSESIRASRLAALRALKPLTLVGIKATARGQYVEYRDEKGVHSDSQTETYFKITATLRSPDWRGVPITLESGKKMAKTFAEVAVTFKGPDDGLCSAVGGGGCMNVLRYQIQPDEKITLSLWVKKPGHEMLVEERDFVFDYKALYSPDEFVDPHVDPYRKLLTDAIAGNQTLFVSTDEIKASWKFIDPIVRAWHKNKSPLRKYSAGSTPENSIY